MTRYELGSLTWYHILADCQRRWMTGAGWDQRNLLYDDICLLIVAKEPIKAETRMYHLTKAVDFSLM